MTDVARPSFRRPGHRIIAEALAEMKASWLLGCKCFFGGGTAFVLQHGEYRLSRDLDFLCADAEGYRELRTKAVREGLSAFFGRQAEPIRAFRADQYGLRTVFRWQSQPIKFETVREALIPLEGAIDARLGVPVLGTADQVAEKLLANADRCIDRSTARRDAIDLGYLVGTTGVFSDGRRHQGGSCLWQRDRGEEGLGSSKSGRAHGIASRGREPRHGDCGCECRHPAAESGRPRRLAGTGSCPSGAGSFMTALLMAAPRLAKSA